MIYEILIFDNTLNYWQLSKEHIYPVLNCVKTKVIVMPTLVLRPKRDGTLKQILDKESYQ